MSRQRGMRPRLPASAAGCSCKIFSWRRGELYVMCRLFARRHCSRCGQPIVYNELVVQTNDRVYHSNCFVCILCNRRFTPGQHFAVAEDGNVYCPSDFQLRQHSGVPARDVVSTRDAPVTAAGGRDSTTAQVPLCLSPLPNRADTVGSIWQQYETSIRSSADDFSTLGGNVTIEW